MALRDLDFREIWILGKSYVYDYVYVYVYVYVHMFMQVFKDSL